ncbi:regulatory protein RecX [Clostridia bacterium]|nr:regulatory protein RecX [Clostridia bacterium]
MWIEKVEQIKKNQYKIFLDSGQIFCVNGKEKKRFHLEENQELSDLDYQEIVSELLEKKAKVKVITLLAKQDYTEKELRNKLLSAFYPEQVIQKLLMEMKQRGYVDDLRYAQHYIEQKSSKMSKLKLQIQLRNKGIEKEIFSSLLEEQNIDEAEQIKKYIESKFRNVSLQDRKEKYKVYQFFARKGYSSEEIFRVLEEVERGEE